MTPTTLLITCEHAGNLIPKPYQHLFIPQQHTLQSHQGYDKGAFETAQLIAHTLQAPFFYSHISRLLVDLNRSPTHPKLFSHPHIQNSQHLQEHVLKHFYTPHRTNIEKHIEQQKKQGFHTLHLAIHSFTPVLHGKKRNTHIGLLYDPSRTHEKTWVNILQSHFKSTLAALLCKKNNPYKGTSDGLTTYLRSQFTNKCYSGIEIEINQALMKNPNTWKKNQNKMVEALFEATSRATLAQ
jgi:predicted N-formylglutamate amidohydrolase